MALAEQSQLSQQIIVRDLGLVEYLPTWQAMQEFTASRDQDRVDEIWILEHHPVFTQGHAGDAEHLLGTGDIPVVQVDRGGQVTYHGPGQLVVYLLLNLRRKKFGVKELVARMEASIVELLAEYGVEAYARPDAPGVYVNEAKICSLGLRVRKGCSFHGLAFNLDMDLEPFNRINHWALMICYPLLPKPALTRHHRLSTGHWIFFRSRGWCTDWPH